MNTPFCFHCSNAFAATFYKRAQDLMVTTNIIQRDISEMEEHSIQKSEPSPSDLKRFGKLEFVVSLSRAEIKPLSSM